MKVTKERIIQTKVRLLAKDFAAEVRGSNLAFRIPDETIDQIPKGYDQYFMDALRMYRLVQRPDKLWEEKR